MIIKTNKILNCARQYGVRNDWSFKTWPFSVVIDDEQYIAETFIHSMGDTGVFFSEYYHNNSHDAEEFEPTIWGLEIMSIMNIRLLLYAKEKFN